MTKVRRLFLVLGLAVVAFVPVHAGAATPDTDSVTVTGNCPFDFRYGESTLPSYPSVTITGAATGLTSGTTYSVYAQPTSAGDGVLADWVVNAVAGSDGRLSYSGTSSVPLEYFEWTTTGLGPVDNIFIATGAGKAGDSYKPSPTIPGQVFGAHPRIHANPSCNPWTAPGGTTLRLATPSTFTALESTTQRFMVSLDSSGVELYRLATGNGTDTQIWKLSRAGAGRLVMQRDGNLVLYSTAGRPLWQTRTYGSAGARLVLQRDANVVVYSKAGKALWQSGTAGR